MKAVLKISLVGIAGVIIGAGGLSALQAATATPKAYLIANLIEVKNQDLYGKYRAAVLDTQASFGGDVLVRGASPVAVDKSVLPKGTMVIVEFPSLKNLQDWWNSPAYSAIRPLRENGTVGTDYALEGVPPT